LARHRGSKRNRQSRNVLRHRRGIAGLGAAAGMFLAAAVTPLATAPAAGADSVNPVVNTISGPALFDPPGGDGGGGQGGAGGHGGAGGNGGHGGNGGSGGAGGAPGAGGAGGAGGAPGPGGQPGQPGHPGQPGQPG
jgi:hypothetical protein